MSSPLKFPFKQQQQQQQQQRSRIGGDDIMNKLENEKYIVKQLFEQLLGYDNNSSFSNSNNLRITNQINNLFNGNYDPTEQDRFIIKNFTKIHEIILLLKDEEISSFIKIKILDQLIQILSYSSNNTINLIQSTSPINNNNNVN
ncbi:hypothetical protein DDB_G0271644 [Dictyostelium discoideum AX4]|uniref:hypothetical protein n=1 Tax=Dictyostelium discoideum AX4 TaxID=352472 RepID=UPI00004E4754|nr:hypothetical protein DDB_G0271644 [Dictyostelium discoideum AX4]EAL71686.1 hypothetical protein DDB_G0271644 [Dictyostelium discoideum AX4]|eukprot:XP_645594.1 hypothetical protein DDB_G0271644 [Dictyostelium discoideum AX4]